MARLTFIGLSITSSWGNGHATTYRALIQALAARGHEVTFLEQERPYYADNRDMPNPAFCRTRLYDSPDDLFARFEDEVREADAVIVGSYVAEGVKVGRWATQVAQGPTAFYDIDTPVTLAALRDDGCDYISTDLLPRYDLYLSFTGGPVLKELEGLGAPRAAALFCSVDPTVHRPMAVRRRWQLGYLGTYSPDRQPGLEQLLLKPAAQRPGMDFVVAGPQYPDSAWPENVQRIPHLPPQEHSRFYCGQAVTLNLTRAAMRKAGHSPSVRLFEAAACGVPVLSDIWDGLNELFEPGQEIFLARNSEEAIDVLARPEGELARVGAKARARVLARHTSDHRAAELEQLLDLRARSGARAGRHASAASSSSAGTGPIRIR